MNKTEKVYDFVNHKIRLLQNDSPWSKSTLAKLRRGAGKDLAEAPDVWEVVLNGLYDEPQDNKSPSVLVTEVELAVYTALTLYAIHQQGKGHADGVSKNNGGLSFGSAIRLLISPDKTNEGSIKRRFDTIITSSDLSELSHHGRGIIQLMRKSEVPVKIDYPQFAKDLYRYQFPEGRNDVRLKWGRDFYRQTREEKIEEKEC